MKIIHHLLICIFLFLTACSTPTKPKSIAIPEAELINKAMQARKHAYCPYSKYQVGAAIQTGSGKIFSGTNVENAAYGSTICAERAALLSAITDGSSDLQAIAIVTKDGGSPCGSCRQMLNEFNPEMEIILADASGKIKKQCKLSDLLIDAFGPKNLSK